MRLLIDSMGTMLTVGWLRSSMDGGFDPRGGGQKTSTENPIPFISSAVGMDHEAYSWPIPAETTWSKRNCLWLLQLKLVLPGVSQCETIVIVSTNCVWLFSRGSYLLHQWYQQCWYMFEPFEYFVIHINIHSWTTSQDEHGSEKYLNPNDADFLADVQIIVPGHMILTDSYWLLVMLLSAPST